MGSAMAYIPFLRRVGEGLFPLSWVCAIDFIISLHTMIPGKPLFYWNGGSFTSFCFALFCMYIVLLVARGQRPVYNLWSRRFPIACSLLGISCFIGSTEIIFSFFFVLFILISYSHVRGTGIQHIFFPNRRFNLPPSSPKKENRGGANLKAVKQVEAPAARTSVSGWHGLSWHYFQTPPLIASAATGRIGLLVLWVWMAVPLPSSSIARPVSLKICFAPKLEPLHETFNFSSKCLWSYHSTHGLLEAKIWLCGRYFDRLDFCNLVWVLSRSNW